MIRIFYNDTDSRLRSMAALLLFSFTEVIFKLVPQMNGRAMCYLLGVSLLLL